MDNAVNVGVSLEDLVEVGLVGDIELNELGLLAADGLDTVQSLSGGVVEVVGNDDLVASLQQSQGGEGANVARATAGVVSGIDTIELVRLTQQQEQNQQT